MTSFVLYCLSVYFIYHVLNHSDLGAPIRCWVYPRVGWHVSYALACVFCLTYWVTLFAALGFLVPLPWVLSAPVVNLFAFKVFCYLGGAANKP